MSEVDEVPVFLKKLTNRNLVSSLIISCAASLWFFTIGPFGQNQFSSETGICNQLTSYIFSAVCDSLDAVDVPSAAPQEVIRLVAARSVIEIALLLKALGTVALIVIYLLPMTKTRDLPKKASKRKILGSTAILAAYEAFVVFFGAQHSKPYSVEDLIWELSICLLQIDVIVAYVSMLVEQLHRMTAAHRTTYAN
jgi:hypothetical protein